MKWFLTVAIVTLVTLSSPTITAQSGDPLLGTFRLNVAKSKYEPGPAPKSEIRTYEAFGTDGLKVRYQRVEADGGITTVMYSAKYDGKDYPLAGSPDADAIALKKVDRLTIDSTVKKNGKVVQTTRAVVSADGKTRTLTSSGTKANGQKFMNVAVYDRETTSGTR
jgi:hypothetical protein